MLLRTRDGSVEKLKHTGMPLGVMEEATWEQMTVTIEPGDAMVLYTDGITDAQDAKDEFFGLERLEAALRSLKMKTAAEIRDGIRQEVRQFQGGVSQSDDLTLVVVVRGEG